MGNENVNIPIIHVSVINLRSFTIAQDDNDDDAADADVRQTDGETNVLKFRTAVAPGITTH